MSRAMRAISSALPVELRLSSDTISGRRLALLAQPAHVQARQQADRDFGLHVGELFLDQLIGRERPAELLAVERVLARRVPAEFRGAERAPADAEARVVEAAERPFQPRHVGQQVFFGHEHLVHHDLAGGRCAHRELAFDLARGEAFHAALEDEPANHAGVVLRPHHHDVGDRRVRDPQLGAAQRIAAVDFAGAGYHAAGIGAVIGFGQAEAAEQFARGHARQILLTLFLAAIGVNRRHRQRGLHAARRAERRIDALEFAHDETVGDIADAGAAVAFERRAEKTELAHLAHHLDVEGLVAVRVQDARHQLFLRVLARRVADQLICDALHRGYASGTDAIGTARRATAIGMKPVLNIPKPENTARAKSRYIDNSKLPSSATRTPLSLTLVLRDREA